MSSPEEFLFFAFVSVELLLQIRLGVCDSPQRTQRCRELLATCSAGSDAWHRANVLNYVDGPFCHELDVRSAQEASVMGMLRQSPWRQTNM